MRFNIMVSFLMGLSGTAANAGFLVPADFPKTVADLSFVERLALTNSGYEQFESEYDANGNCISGCSYAAPKWEDELSARARWDALSRKNLQENHDYTENSDGSLTPPVDEQITDVPPTQPPVEYSVPYPEQPNTQVQDCANKNLSFGNRDIPYGNPLGYKACIISYYGPRELYNRKFHYGIDFRAASGTPVYAPANGIVKTVFMQNKTCGNGLVIEHSDGYSTKYCHFESVAVKQNERVSAGCLIGKSDNTGQSTGPHLHYSVLYKGQAVDPINFIEAGHQSCRR